MLKMEINGGTPTASGVAVPAVAETTSPVASPSPTSSPPPSLSPQQPPQQPVVLSPCAACKILRRRCAEKCVLAPYFPPTDPAKFTIAHRVFGASNIIKFLQVLFVLLLPGGTRVYFCVYVHHARVYMSISHLLNLKIITRNINTKYHSSG